MTAEQGPGAVPEAADPTGEVAGAEVDVDRAIEAILMVAEEPQTPVALATAIGAPVRAVKQALARIGNDFDGILGGPRRGFELRQVGGGWRVFVRPEFDRVVADFVHTQHPSRLSQAALETLAVIAYRQPITRSQVAAIRAVNVDSVVRTLAGRGLVVELFTDSETGAINYGTSETLLEQLGINSIDELPPLAPLLDTDMEGLSDERR